MSKIQAPFYYDKSDQRSSEGIRLEELTTASIVLASHAGGFGGVSFPVFLGGLLYELGVNEQAKMVQLLQDVEHAGWTRIVPFLSPPTAEWPEWMNDNSMRFGNLVRTRTYDRIELQARSNSISGGNEEKSSAVDVGVMKSILMCVPNEPMVHLVLMDTLRKRHVTGEVAAEPRIHVVVTNSLQTGCFPDGFSWETFVCEQRLQNVDFYRISEGSTLQEIEGMTNRSKTEVVANKKLVLFIELGKKYPSGQ
ncbi:hypothetical protein DVH05_017445 [Phytophthora capsici]|nr:hypothetical protein DVH05_017445 [Phytophthora capsici]